MSDIFWSIDFPALLIAMLAALACSLPGSFLVLRRESMMADALSHVVLPGLALAFILTGSLGSGVMFIGALLACLVATLLIKVLREYAGIESGAAMGIVFTSLFALGLVLLEKGVGSRVHLDAHHALYGGLELSYWPLPHTWNNIPHAIISLSILNVLSIAFIWLCLKELTLASFDSVYAQTIGLRRSLISAALMILVALSAVACFEAVGSVLVIALFICPAASARMFCDRVHTQLILSAVLAVFMAVIGYVAAAFVPTLLGFEHSLSAAGMIALVGGIILGTSILCAPVYGVLQKRK